MKELEGLSDNQVLRLIYTEVHEIKERTSKMEDKLEEQGKAQREIEVTIYGDDKRKVKGILHHVEALKESLSKYKKWEFTIGVFVGFIGFVWAVLLGLKELGLFK